MISKILRYILAVSVLASVFVSCDRRQVIPDSTLKQIFKEVYLTNAYFSTVKNSTPQDSMDVYRPILKKYGYTTDDLEHTVLNFSKRKSSRLSDVLEKAIDELQDESKFYDYRVAVLDTIDVRAGRLFTREVYYDSVITVRQVRDTAKLRLLLPVEEGVYNISYVYEFDTIDKNSSLRTTFHLIDTAGKRRSTSTNWMSQRRRSTYTTKIDATEADTALLILFANYPAKMKEPHLTIDSIRVDYYLPNDKALDSLDKLIFKNLFPSYENYRWIAPDSLALADDPSGLDSLGAVDP